MFMKADSQAISPWHSIPLHAGNGTYNFVCEIPKDTSAKMECATVRGQGSGSRAAVGRKQ